jgi:hypothetical protein
LSIDEATHVLNTLADEAAKKNISLFLERWNNTGTYINQISHQRQYLKK